jgi:hypothetical protein
MNNSDDLKKLVDDFGNAALRAGRSNSGLCIDPYASLDWERMQELRAKLHEIVVEYQKMKECVVA